MDNPFQEMMRHLYNVDVRTINEHLVNIFNEADPLRDPP